MLHGELVTLRQPSADDIPRLTEIRRTPEVLAQWSSPGEVAAELADPATRTYVVVHDGRVVGATQWYAEDDPEYRHAGIDIYLDPGVHSRGIGTDVVRTMARHLIVDHGHHRVVIDSAADNTAAIRCYTKVGFRPVGVLRRYWRGPDGQWKDGLLMDLLADEFASTREASLAVG